MDEHISFDELQTFVFAEELTPEIIRLGARINSCVLTDSDVADQYTALLELRYLNEKQVKQVAKHIEQGSESLEEQRNLIEEIMSGSQEEEKSQEAGQSQYNQGLSQSR